MIIRKCCLCVISEIIQAASEALSLRRMTLAVPNALPGFDIQLGTNNDDKS